MTGDEMAERGTDRWIVAELREQLEEALSIIEELWKYGMYNPKIARKLEERVQVLRLKQ